MRPLVLKGHERPVTFLLYNQEGDLLFTAGRDKDPNVWFSDNGERLGTYRGHNGAVFCLDVTPDSRRLATASADFTAKIWDVKTGRVLLSLKHKTAVRSVHFAVGGRQLLTSIDNKFSQAPAIFIWDLPEDIMTNDGAEARELDKPTRVLLGHEGTVTQALWGPLNRTIFSCSEDSTVRVWDAETGNQIHVIADHRRGKGINHIAFSKDGSHFITASGDHTARLYDTRTYTLLKTFETDRPVNSAAISPSPKHEQIAMAGGQDASQVTTSSQRAGGFDVKFYHKIFESEIGSVKGHFGPVNAVAFSPDGKGFASGGEDGFVRIHKFDADYLEYKGADGQ